MQRGLSLLALLLGYQALPRACGKSVGHADCKHGMYNHASNKCECYENWRTAGITDTVDFFEGVCEQFTCKSDAMCRQALPDVPNPTCKVHNWNCYCGWEYAFHNSWHGYEVGEGAPGGGECMGVLYTFAIWSSTSLWKFLSVAWQPILIGAAILLPFGRKRAICDHNNPSLWNYLRACLGVASHCRGACVLNSEYNLDGFKDDVAWSIYFLELGVWMYIFITVFCLTIVWICSVILWVVIILILIVLAVAAVCMGGVGAVAGGVGDGNCCESCDCCPGDPCNCEYCNLDCCNCCAHGHGDLVPADTFYWSGTYPYDPVWGYWGHGTRRPGGGDDWSCCCCDSRSQVARCLCGPIAKMIYVFPVAPENAWGGLLGYYIFGTHHLTPETRLYQGGNPFIEFLRMGWRRRADLHGDAEWRAGVRRFLIGDDEPPEAGGNGGGQAQPPPARPPPGQVQVQPGRRQAARPQMGRSFTRMEVGQDAPVQEIGAARAIHVQRQFNKEEDKCVPSSFEDYKDNQCWICMGPNDNWDLWLSCRHLFCKDCSTEMLIRRLPCPLCRSASSTVLRGMKYDTPPTSDDSALAGN